MVMYSSEASQRIAFRPKQVRRSFLIMPEFGMQGQRRLREGSVLLIGAGGLGSPLALYLAAAGVGTCGARSIGVSGATSIGVVGASSAGAPGDCWRRMLRGALYVCGR